MEQHRVNYEMIVRKQDRIQVRGLITRAAFYPLRHGGTM